MVGYSLIEAASVRQHSLGAVERQEPAGPRTFDPVKGTVINVYPVGHPKNRLKQTVVDVQPTAEHGILRRVPLCTLHAHQETGTALANSLRRQPYAPKDRNREEGTSVDVRPGTFVWVHFLGHDGKEPVAVAGMRFGGQGAPFPQGRQVVDRVQADGSVAPTETPPLDSDMETYPRAVHHVFNGVRAETDNRGNYHLQASTDRTPVFPGHNGIPAAAAPEGSIGISARGGRFGNLILTTGRHSRHDEASVGRHGRQSLGADDGTIRDDTRSTLGHIIQRVWKGAGRIWHSAAGGSDGRWYAESRARSYLALDHGGAEVHGAQQVVLDGGRVYLGSGEAASELVLWPQLKQVLDTLWQMVDQHVHTDPDEGVTGPPVPAVFTQTFDGIVGQCKAADCFADPTNAPSPEPQDDPEHSG